VFAGYAIQAKWQGRPPLSTAQAFASLALINIVRGPATMLLYSLPMMMSTGGSFQRIEDFLKKDTFEDHRPLLDGKRSSQIETDKAVKFKNVVLDIKTTTESAQIDFDLPRGSIIMITGPVGSGKSTLLNAVLGEVHLKSGKICISTQYIGYCSQTPWLQNTTVRKNIIGCDNFNEAWYQHILDVCNLHLDIRQMPKKDNTMLGSRGISVSGGQKHRIVRPFYT
jgi:ATP-binding cassette, subfamily C (CFTR/MRP), member 1